MPVLFNEQAASGPPASEFTSQFEEEAGKSCDLHQSLLVISGIYNSTDSDNLNV